VVPVGTLKNAIGTIARYQQARELAYRKAESELPALFEALCPHLMEVPFRLAVIDEVALTAWSMIWKEHPARRVDWDWREERRGHQNTLSRFELAVWSSEHLCALAIGKPSKGRENLTIRGLEGSPLSDHPLKKGVRFAVVSAALAYANALSCKELRLSWPVKEVQCYYVDMGFSLAGTPDNCPYCWLEV
jgi:hypothetical protein